MQLPITGQYLPAVTVMELVPVPAVIVQPVGTVQLYEVALGTAVMLNTNPVTPGQTGVVTEIIPGVAGVPGFTVTGNVWAELVPHEFVAVTVIFPF